MARFRARVEFEVSADQEREVVALLRDFWQALEAMTAGGPIQCIGVEQGSIREIAPNAAEIAGQVRLF